MNYKRLYLENSYIFGTIVTNKRLPILIQNIEILKRAWLNTSQIYNYKLIAYTVQPDHIHFIICPKNIYDYPKIVKSFKYSFTKNVGLVKPTYSKIWQNRYWEHTIRDEKDLYRHLDYIHYNSMKHLNIVPIKWEYSSFKKFIHLGIYENNWCNIEDKNNINSLNYE